MQINGFFKIARNFIFSRQKIRRQKMIATFAYIFI